MSNSAIKDSSLCVVSKESLKLMSLLHLLLHPHDHSFVCLILSVGHWNSSTEGNMTWNFDRPVFHREKVLLGCEKKRKNTGMEEKKLQRHMWRMLIHFQNAIYRQLNLCCKDRLKESIMKCVTIPWITLNGLVFTLTHEPLLLYRLYPPIKRSRSKVC